MGMLLSLLSVKAQNIKPLSIGDTVPDLVLHNVINYKDSVIRLSDFKEKLVILDFFATWCTGCIASFPDMEKLQQENQDKLAIFIVSKPNDDSLPSLQRFLKKPLAATGKPLALPILAKDTTIGKYFPHRIIPHTIWLRHRKVIAITNSKAINGQSVKSAYEKGVYLGPLKTE